jgi:hypothetical protein
LKQKNRALFCIAVGGMVLTLCMIGFGQDEPHRGKFSVPFEFDVGGTKLPAGQYVLEAASAPVATLRSADGKTVQNLFFGESGEPVKSAKVVFAVRHGKYYLTEVWAWYGKMKYAGFHPHEGDETKDIPMTLE